jgi:hypothetical protein
MRVTEASIKTTTAAVATHTEDHLELPWCTKSGVRKVGATETAHTSNE